MDELQQAIPLLPNLQLTSTPPTNQFSIIKLINSMNQPREEDIELNRDDLKAIEELLNSVIVMDVDEEKLREIEVMINEKKVVPEDVLFSFYYLLLKKFNYER